jgi:asparagine synthase (glutamine-hydrolysing)
MLLDHRPYAGWLAATSYGLREPVNFGTPPEGWGAQPHLYPWASEHAVELLAGLLRAAAQGVQPLAPDRGRHAWIYQAQKAGRRAGLVAHASAATGLGVDSPFCDDAVVTACLMVRTDQASSPWSYKPLLAAAMDGLVPSRLLHRSTKDHFLPEWHAGLRMHRRDLADWAEDSHLVAAGVAEETELRRVLLSSEMFSHGMVQLDYTLGAEGWLRDLVAHPTPSYLVQREGTPVEPTA